MNKRGFNRALYDRWKAMISRCKNPSNKSFKTYGGRGIKVCERWMDFQLFYNDILRKIDFSCTEKNSNWSIDRIDNDGPYSPENTRISNPKGQARNRSNNRYVFGEALVYLSEKTGLSDSTIRKRIKRGWSGDKIVSSPISKGEMAKIISDNNRKRAVSVYYKGEMYLISDLSEKFSIPTQTLRSRIFRSGWSVEKAVSTAILNAKDRSNECVKRYKIDGEFLTLKEISKKYDINYVTLHARINRYGYSLEEAIKK